ncbi:hypothetical protein Mmah_0973 [Methanohalophilus mahii DSM 5219]|uniref:Uncharacterized protein n=1 Tax=Methanohalophilus mahii (strain ATCC 35705 / DSM 5219 / SLP) TaxID=547558 RepID=D5EBE2_METMS|nr:hypothetical protein Mmah_0973 [Methanohalophilus mahii DSM 5219]
MFLKDTLTPYEHESSIGVKEASLRCEHIANEIGYI